MVDWYANNNNQQGQSPQKSATPKTETGSLDPAICKRSYAIIDEKRMNSEYLVEYKQSPTSSSLDLSDRRITRILHLHTYSYKVISI
ncbi:hypothetical protein CDV36_004431 [Fusarium kuroshium]|uniref:Uncharacterized protein n=1 Tax=Fusarium kuroshium TaxID=2010991 RepID=A0A3M2SFM5_9HYPO|nr:hypothetical protein CDV36_004431 [Fusarium kuroshium]